MSKQKVKWSKAITVVTTSEIQCFRDCARKHHFRYRERLRPRYTGKALAIGHIFHAGMSVGLRAGWVGVDGLTTDQRLTRQLTASATGIEDKVMGWIGTVVEHDRYADYDHLLAFADDAGAMLKFMLANYFQQTRRDLENLILVETEQPFAVRLRDAIGRRGQVEFQGVRDAAFYDPTYNTLELHEHKSVSSLPQDIGKRAEMDPQTTGYVASLLEARAAAGSLRFLDGTPLPKDVIIGRVAYNAVRKKRPTEPKVNKDGKVSVAAIDTLPAMYEEALNLQAAPVEQGGRGIPVTPAQGDKLREVRERGNTYFARVEYPLNRDDLERWRNDTFIDAGRIRAADRDPRQRTRNPGHCNMPWSLPCEYRSVCLDDTPETRALFQVLDDAHPEVREAEEIVTSA
jgi:catechol 2,3-dioxygenase-like lactoylglutathione lyase family enzyme